jgi:hypothetical protein
VLLARLEALLGGMASLGHQFGAADTSGIEREGYAGVLAVSSGA